MLQPILNSSYIHIYRTLKHTLYELITYWLVYNKYIYISYHILDAVEQKDIEFTMEQNYMLHILSKTVNTIVADALATEVARASPGMVGTT